MKTLKITLLLLLLVFFVPAKLVAQKQIVAIHEDPVKPGMVEEYKKAAKELVDACKKYNLQNADWIMTRLDNGTFRYISNITSMAELDINHFLPLADKMGKDKLKAIFERFDKCYSSHYSYTLTHESELTYMPGGPASISGQNYKKFHKMYVTPANTQAFKEKAKAINALYAKKGAKESFIVFRSGFGCEKDYFLVMISAKDQQSYKQTGDETEALLGEEGNKAFDELMKTVENYEVYSGYENSELSYTSTK